MRAESQPLEPRSLGRYQLRHKVAVGGMGTVYLGRLTTPHGFAKNVAIKVIHPYLAEDPRFVSMFMDEARVHARIIHPNVCNVIDFGEEDGTAFLVMDWMHGETFLSVLQHGHERRAFQPWIAARVVADAARGLHYAHNLVDAAGRRLDVVHRDVSPHNLFVLYDGNCKVLDFGVARARGRLSKETQTGEVKGKVPYMSPEQIINDNVDHQADVWSLGVVLWEALTGRHLFSSSNAGSAMRTVLEARIPSPSEIAPSVPEELAEIALAALKRDRAERVASAAALADLLERYLYGIGEPAGPAQIASWIDSNFAEEKAQREALLRDDAAVDAEVDALIEEGDEPTDEHRSALRTRPFPRQGLRALGQSAIDDPVVGDGTTDRDVTTAPLVTGADPRREPPVDEEDELTDAIAASTVGLSPPADEGLTEAMVAEVLGLDTGPPVDVDVDPVDDDDDDDADGSDEDDDDALDDETPDPDGGDAPGPEHADAEDEDLALADPAPDGATTKQVELDEDAATQPLLSAAQVGLSSRDAVTELVPRADDDSRRPLALLLGAVAIAAMTIGFAVVWVSGPGEPTPVVPPAPPDEPVAPDEAPEAAADPDRVPLHRPPALDVPNLPPVMPILPPPVALPAEDVPGPSDVPPPSSDAPAPPSPEDRAAPRRQFGTLNLVAIPAGDVFLRGRRIGRTPLSDRRLPAGTHVLTVRSPDGKVGRVRVQIVAGQQARQTVRLN